MLRLKPYNINEADIILSWSKDKIAFYKWSAGILGEYPITKEKFDFVNNLMAFTAIEDDEIVGFFTMRRPSENFDELRFGFVVVDPSKRGKGYGKRMLQLGLKFAFEIYGAKKVSLSVFENNESAYFCYKSVGFDDVILDKTEIYYVLGEEWKCKELMIETQWLPVCCTKTLNKITKEEVKANCRYFLFLLPKIQKMERRIYGRTEKHR